MDKWMDGSGDGRTNGPMDGLVPLSLHVTEVRDMTSESPSGSTFGWFHPYLGAEQSDFYSPHPY